MHFVASVLNFQFVRWQVWYLFFFRFFQKLHSLAFNQPDTTTLKLDLDNWNSLLSYTKITKIRTKLTEACKEVQVDSSGQCIHSVHSHGILHLKDESNTTFAIRPPRYFNFPLKWGYTLVIVSWREFLAGNNTVSSETSSDTLHPHVNNTVPFDWLTEIELIKLNTMVTSHHSLSVGPFMLFVVCKKTEFHSEYIENDTSSCDSFTTSNVMDRVIILFLVWFIAQLNEITDHMGTFGSLSYGNTILNWSLCHFRVQNDSCTTWKWRELWLWLSFSGLFRP